MVAGWRRGKDDRKHNTLAPLGGSILPRNLKVHKIEIFFGFDFEICIISLLVMSKY